MTALAALTERMVLATVRDDLPSAVIAPVGIFIVFNLALRNIIKTGDLSYPQYLLPIIIVQVIFFGALTTLDRAFHDRRSEFGVRLRMLPMPAATPLAARMLYCLIRGTLALLTAIAVGYIFGFRLSGGLGGTAAFVALVLVFTLALSLGADAAGTRLAEAGIGTDGSASQLLLIPQTVLVMLSTGLAPAEAFPDWVQPFVKYQPVSQVTETLRGLTTGHLRPGNLAATLTWCAALLIVFGAAAVRAERDVQ